MSLLQNVRNNIFNGSLEFVHDVSDGIDKLAQVESVNNSKSPSSLNIVILNLFDRIYGEDATTFAPPSNWEEKYGYWLIGTSGSIEDKKYAPAKDPYLSARGVRIVELLAPAGKLFTNLLKMNWHYQMNIKMLSEKAQMKLSGSKEYSFVAAAHHLLYDNLIKLQHQHKLMRTESGDALLRVDVFMYHLVCMLRYAVYQKDFSKTYCTGPARSNARSVAAISNSARAMIATTSGSSMGCFYSAEVSQWKSGNSYLALVEKYIEYFSVVPTGGLRGDSRPSSRVLPYETELFLWLAVDFWVDISMIINRDFSKVSAIYSAAKDSSYFHNHHHHAQQNAFGPKSCSDVVFLDANSPSPTAASLQCSYLLLAHLQGALLGSSDAPYLSVPLMVPTMGGRGSRAGGKGESIVCKMFLLPRGLEILQQPMFDMLRGLFTKFDTISASQQLMAMAVWLRWTQPWRFYDAHSDIFGDDGSRYSAKWRPYVAANLHFYTSLFVMFIRSSVYLSSLSGSYSRDTTLSVMSHGHFGRPSGHNNREVQQICMKLFSIIVGSYSDSSSGSASLFDDIGALYAGVAATGGDVANIGTGAALARETTPSKPPRRNSVRKSARKEGDTPWSAGTAAGRSLHNVSPGSLHRRRLSSPHRLDADEYSDDDDCEPDDTKNLSRLLEPPVSFTQRSTPGGSIYTRTPHNNSMHEASVRFDTPNTGRCRHGDSDTAPRRRLSTTYTPLDSTSPNGSTPALTNSWSGTPANRHRASSTDRRRVDHTATPILSRVKSTDAIAPAEIMSVYHQHSVLFPDECISSSWAGGCSLKEASDVTGKLESLLVQAERISDISDYTVRVVDALRLIPGLFSTGSFHEAGRTLTPGAALSTVVSGESVLYASPERHIGSDLHGKLTPKGRAELFSGAKACQVRSVQHRGDLMFRPLRSNEFPFLARLLIKYSQQLNQKFMLPKAGFTARVSWVDIFEISVVERTKSLPPFSLFLLLDWGYLRGMATAVKRIIHDMLDGCRFNLRFFGNYHLLSYLLCCGAAFLLARNLWGLYFFFSYALLFFMMTTIYFVF